MKNWKSLISWAMFAVSYNFAVYTSKPEPIVYTTGLFAVLMSFAMMFRADFTKDMISKLIDKIKIGERK